MTDVLFFEILALERFAVAYGISGSLKVTGSDAIQ